VEHLNSNASARPSALVRILQRVVRVEQREVAALLWSGAYFFCLLAAYYIIRPLRDDMGLAGGVRNLPWLFMGTLLAMLACNPLFAALVSRYSRRVFLPVVYGFFIANLLLFWVLLISLPESQTVHVGRAFYIWTSVFNLFAVSVFWAFMADVFREEQGRRLFGFIGAGGSIGALTGSQSVLSLVEHFPHVHLLLLSMALLAVAIVAVWRLGRLAEGRAWRGEAAPTAPARPPSAPDETPRAPVADGDARARDGGIWAGILLSLRSPYLLGIVLYMFLYTFTSTILYFHQAQIVDAAFTDRAARTALFARIDLWVNGLTLLIQFFLTGRIMTAFGVGITLTLLPLLTTAGFGVLGVAPVLGVLVVFQVARRVTNFALSRPAREVLYTVVGRDEKYKAKSFIDTFVYRGGDAVGAAAFGLMTGLALTASGMAFVAVPISAVWAGVALWLGRRQRKLAATLARAAAA
jgi:ATP:ADP antiporter, AAA family